MLNRWRELARAANVTVSDLIRESVDEGYQLYFRRLLQERRALVAQVKNEIKEN